MWCNVCPVAWLKIAKSCKCLFSFSDLKLGGGLLDFWNGSTRRASAYFIGSEIWGRRDYLRSEVFGWPKKDILGSLKTLV